MEVSALTSADALLEQDLSSILTPKVLAHLPPSLQTVASKQEWVKARLTECEVLTVWREEIVIGFILLAPFGSEVHLGYLLSESAWGQGFASEMIHGLMTELEKTNVTRVIGGVARNNHASARVLLKNGFTLSGDEEEDGIAHFAWTPTG